MQFRADNVALTAASTDWFIDEAVLLPIDNSVGGLPRDVWQQFIYDQSVQWVMT
jgi:hypothetical protein